MLKKFRNVFTVSLLCSLFIIIMASCAVDDYFDDSENTDPPPAPQEPTPPPPEEPPAEDPPPPEEEPEPKPAPPPPDNDSDLDGAQSIDDTCIVWKPISEGDHKLVVLLTSNYGSPEIFILDENGNKVEQGRYVGATNGGRATYRFSRPGHGYSYTSYLQVGSIKYKVLRPDIRHSC